MDGGHGDVRPLKKRIRLDRLGLGRRFAGLARGSFLYILEIIGLAFLAAPESRSHSIPSEDEEVDRRPLLIFDGAFDSRFVQW